MSDRIELPKEVYVFESEGDRCNEVARYAESISVDYGADEAEALSTCLFFEKAGRTLVFIDARSREWRDHMIRRPGWRPL